MNHQPNIPIDAAADFEAARVRRAYDRIFGGAPPVEQVMGERRLPAGYVVVEQFESGSECGCSTCCSCVSCCSTCGDSDDQDPGRGDEDSDGGGGGGGDDGYESDCSQCRDTRGRFAAPPPPPAAPPPTVPRRDEISPDTRDVGRHSYVNVHRPTQRRESRRSNQGHGEAQSGNHHHHHNTTSQPSNQDSRRRADPVVPRQNISTTNASNIGNSRPNTSDGSHRGSQGFDQPNARPALDLFGLNDATTAGISYWVSELHDRARREIRTRNALAYRTELAALRSSAPPPPVTRPPTRLGSSRADGTARASSSIASGSTNAGRGDDQIRDRRVPLPRGVQGHFMSGGRSASSSTRRRLP